MKTALVHSLRRACLVLRRPERGRSVSIYQRSYIGIGLFFLSLPLWAQTGPDWIVRGSNSAWVGGYPIAGAVCGGAINQPIAQGDDAFAFLECARSAWIAHCTDPGTTIIGIGQLGGFLADAPTFSATGFSGCAPVGASGGWYLDTSNPLCDELSELDPLTFVCIADPGDVALDELYLAAEPAPGAPCPPNETDPCNPADGNTSAREDDYSSTAEGGLAFTRYYNSLGAYKTGSQMGTGWRHTYSRALDEEPDIQQVARFSAPINESSTYASDSDACTLGWDEIKSSVWSGDLASATASFTGGNVCTISSGGSTAAYFPIRTAHGWSNYQAPTSIRTITRADGRNYKFEQSGLDWVNVLDASVQLEQSGSDFIFTDENDTKETFDFSGRLISIIKRNGQTETLEYDLTAAQGGDDNSATLDRVTGPFGHTLTFSYDVNSRLQSVITPDGTVQYGYDSNNNLISATYPDLSTRQYVFENPGLLNHLTGIIDGNGDRYVTWAYDTAGRAILSELAGGKEQVQFAYNPDGSTTVTMGNGATRNYAFSTQQGRRRVATLTGDVCGTCPSGDISDRTHDANGFLDEVLDANGNTTQTIRNSRGLTETMIEAKGSTEQRTTTTIWHPTFRLPTKITSPKNVTDFTYDVNGNIETVTVSSGALTRAWVFNYNANGQLLTINGPRTDVVDITTRTYHNCTTGFECGQLQSVTNALGQVTSYDSYDGSGRLTQLTDPNGLQTGFTYDARGNLQTVTQIPVVGISRVTTRTYDAAQQLKTLSTIDELVLTYSYDAAHYLRTVTDNLGNRIDYDYDSMGNQSVEDSFDPSNVLKWTLASSYDLNYRLDTVTHGGFVTDLTFDAVGNLTGETDPKLANTQHNYDALNRLDDTIDALTGIIDFGYDDHDNLTSVSAANGTITTFEYDDLDNLIKEISPDRGQLIYSYDNAGNRVTELDPRGKLTTYTYDALNRLTMVTFDGGQTIANQYDSGANAIGRLNRITDASGQTDWSYDNFGAVTQKQQTIGAVLLTTAYSYDDNGRLSTMTLPSGKVVTYGYNTYQQNSVTVDGQSILSGASYEPFGPVNGWTWGDGSVHAQSYDLRGLMTSHSIGLDTRALAHDAAGNLFSLTDARQSLTFDYDLLERLTSAGPIGGGGGGGPLFSSPPVLLASIQTMKNEIGNVPSEPSAPWLTVATKNVTATGAKVSLERSQVNTGSIDVKEKIGYLAIEVGSGGSFVDSGGNTITYEAQITPEIIKGWDTGCFETNFLNVYSSKPVVMASLNSHNGGDGGWLRRCSLNKTALGLTVDEDKFGDPERIHNNAESAGMVAFSAAFDAQFTDSNGTWGMEVVKITLPSTVTLPAFTNVAFRQGYATKPIVIVLPNKSGSNPASVRIRNVSKTGFEVTQVEPAPQNGTHNQMKIHYVAIEKGVHTLPDGTKLEAGRKATKKQKHGAGVVGNESWARISFSGSAPTMNMSQEFAYDANSNRTNLTEDGIAYPYFYQAASNRLTSTTGPVAKTYNYDAAGNVTSDGIHTYGYDDRGRLVDVDSGLVTYQHNGQGQRVVKNDGFQTLFIYDDAGMLTGEYDSQGVAIQDTVYFQGAPVAVLEGTNIYHVHTDHLGTPRVITDGTVEIWRWESDPFGSTAAQEDPDGDQTLLTYNLRFLGQYFDQETGIHYNYFRSFDPSTGRYMESDPIGLAAGPNAYAYVGGNPLMFYDPYGLRGLSVAEKDFLRKYYGNCLDLDKIDLRKRLIGKRAWSPRGSKIRVPKTYFVDRNKKNDLRLDNATVASVFAHEAAHVWQRENGVAVTRRGIGLQILDFFGKDVYDYDESITDPAELMEVFEQGNIEQQGKIIQDYVERDQLGEPTNQYSKIAEKIRECDECSE